jgi:hypothetical protein
MRRLVLLLAVGLLAGVCVLVWQTAAIEEAKAQSVEAKEILRLRKELKERDETIALLRKDLKERDATILQLRKQLNQNANSKELQQLRMELKDALALNDKLRRDLQRAKDTLAESDKASQRVIDNLRRDLRAATDDAARFRVDALELQTLLKRRDTQLVQLQADLAAEANKRVQAELAAAAQRERAALLGEKLAEAEKALAQAPPDLRKVPYVHAVIFYLKKDAPAGEADSLIEDTHKLLAKIPTVRGLWVGKPAEKATPKYAITDFHVGLVVLFDDYAGLEKYLEHDLHTEFLDKHGKHWDKVPVYDFVHQKPDKGP